MTPEQTTGDPLLHSFQFPLEELFFPYGFPLLIRTNDVRVLKAARESFGDYAQASSAEPLRFDVAIVGEEDGPFPPNPVVRAHGHLIWFVCDAKHFGSCDFSSGFAVAWLTPRVFCDTVRLRFHFLESLGLSLVAERYLTGIHAACVATNGRGVLLSGDAGSGKSSLAYACAKKGWTYVADDGSFLIRHSSDNIVIGNHNRIRFRPSAAEIFPELKGLLATERPNGKMTIELRTADLGLPSTVERIPVQSVVFLNRQKGATARIAGVPQADALSRLYLEHFGRSSTLQEQMDSLSRVLEGGVFELTYSDLNEAVGCLQELVRTQGS